MGDIYREYVVTKGSIGAKCVLKGVVGGGALLHLSIMEKIGEDPKR